MRLSDAIALGRTLVERLRADIFDDHKGGCCARGMAAKAVGDSDWTARSSWPWLEDQNIEVNCPSCGYGKFMMPAFCINHMMDHVMEGEMTLEQLIDHVRSFEPPEISETEQTNQTQGETIQHEVHA